MAALAVGPLVRLASLGMKFMPFVCTRVKPGRAMSNERVKMLASIVRRACREGPETKQ